jgi:hypothetical protein
MNPNDLGSLEKGGNMLGIETLLEVADVYGISPTSCARLKRGGGRRGRARDR